MILSQLELNQRVYLLKDARRHARMRPRLRKGTVLAGLGRKKGCRSGELCASDFPALRSTALKTPWPAPKSDYLGLLPGAPFVSLPEPTHLPSGSFDPSGYALIDERDPSFQNSFPDLGARLNATPILPLSFREKLKALGETPEFGGEGAALQPRDGLRDLRGEAAQPAGQGLDRGDDRPGGALDDAEDVPPRSGGL